MTTELRCAVVPVDDGEHRYLEEAVEAAGGVIAAPEDADAIVWTDPTDPRDLGEILGRAPDVRWVALPYAGIEPFTPMIDRERTWTCGKGVYAAPVAEHALGLALAGLRGGAHYACQDRWSAPRGRNLIGSRVTVLGGGEVARRLLELLTPFDVEATVVRNRPDPVPGARVVGRQRLHESLATADVVFLALALTPDTRGILDAEAIAVLPDHAWIVNVARGEHVVTDALVDALRDGRIGGAALDVTDPEPLPAGHPLWSLDEVVITPHVGNTPEMGRVLLAGRVRENVRRARTGEPLIGQVDIELGY